MDALAWAVLILASLVAVVTFVYVHVILPGRWTHRIETSVTVFTKAVELRFPMLDGFADEVSRVAEGIALEMGLPSGRIAELKLSARLSLIGTCAMPYSLNERSILHWSEAELQMFFDYPRVSKAMLELVPSLRHLAPILNSATDANGRDDRCLEAKILDTAATFVWLDRRYGRILAMDEVRRRAGSGLNAEITEKLDGVLHSFGGGDPRPKVAV